MSDKDGQGQVQGAWQENQPSQPMQGNFQQIQPQGLPDKKGNIGKVIGLSIFALIIGLLIGSGSAYFIGKQAQTNKDIQRIKRLSKAQEEAQDKSDSFTTDGQSVQFNWTLKDLGRLSYTNDEGLGLTADQIVETYGLASSAEYDRNRLLLRWGPSVRDKEQNISFQFDKVDQNYYLRQVVVGDSFKEYRKIIIEENNSLKPVFYDNIRDFLGKNSVNKAITATLQNLDINSFCMLNNGITIIADKIQITGSTVVITNYQIVNGCQTSHVLYENKNLPGIDELLIPIKLIATKDDETRGKITKATNSQTSIKPEQLEALSDFQKNLEIFYSTFDENKRLYYERRTGQYRLEEIPKTRIVNISQQIKSVTAMFLENPHGVSGNYGTIVKSVGSTIFNLEDKEIIYYTSSLTQYKIEKLISDGIIDKKYNKARYHATMLFRIYISGKDVPRFNENRMEKYCKKIIDVLSNDEKCNIIFSKIIDFIASQKEIDFSDRKTFERKETTDFLLKKISQLKEFVEKSL